MPMLVRVVPLALSFTLLTGCVDFADFGNAERYKEDFHKTMPLNSGGSLTLEGFNGSIDISGWDRDSIEIDGTKYASTKQALDALEVETSGGAGSVRVRSVRPSLTHGNMGVRYSVRIPKRVTLERIASTNGAIRIEGLEGNATLHTSNGSIRVRDLKGALTAESTNGGIEARALNGAANLRTSNGSIDAETQNGGFEAETTNGAIHARLSNPGAASRVRLESNNGRIELRLDAGAVPPVTVSTSNSSITLYLPSDANARVRATTTHGRVSSDFPGLEHAGPRERPELDGTIGGGGPLLDLTTTNGSIHVMRR